MTWQGREVKVEEGSVLMSARGDPSNWDYFGGQSGALALNTGAPVERVRPIDDDRLLIVAQNGNYVLCSPDGAWLVRVATAEEYEPEDPAAPLIVDAGSWTLWQIATP
jgi:hypothetical protein